MWAFVIQIEYKELNKEYWMQYLGTRGYFVASCGNVTVQIYHCSDFVLRPNAARSITLDTRTYRYLALLYLF